MKGPKDFPPDFTDLRRRAEEQIAAEAISPEELAPDQAARLIHELRVHQIELEMQNEELRRSQAELEESRSKYADLYDFAPVGYLTLDHRDKILEANLTAATLLDVERSKLINRFFSHFLVERDRRVFRQIMDDGRDLQGRRGEVHLQDGGDKVQVMLLDILFLTDAAGQERRRISMTDITELKRTQEELRLHKEDLEELVTQRTTQLIQANEHLREANAQLQALFEATPLAIGVFDHEGKMITTNRAGELMFGWTREELKGHLPPVIPPDYFEESMAVMKRALQGESFVGAEVKQQHKDGHLLDISLSAAPHQDGKGSFRGFVALAEDITEQKRTREALRQALEEKTVLLKEIQHRVKNNFQIVASLLGMQAKGSPNPEVVEALEEACQRVVSMAALHEALYRSESLAHINFHAYVEELCQHLRGATSLRAAPVVVDNLVPPIRLPLKESVPCGLIINELVTNALKHAFPEDRPGKVSVSLEHGAEGQLVLTVSDKGVGLPPGMDVVSAPTLGLRLVSGLASQLGGRLTVSQPECGGVVFQVSFPIPEGTRAEANP